MNTFNSRIALSSLKSDIRSCIVGFKIQINFRMSSNLCNANCAMAKNWCLTDTQFDKVDFHWTISNFDFHEKRGIKLVSPEFSAATNEKLKFYLQCKPNGTSENKDTISLHLGMNLSSDVLGSVFAKFRFSVLAAEQKTLKSVESNVCEFDKRGSLWGFNEFIKKDASFRDKLSLNSEKLMIRCVVEFSEMENIVNNFHQCKPEVPACNLSEDLESLYENRQFSDVTLSVKGKDYQAHKNILAARSPVFAAMFRHNMMENEQNRVVIEDIDEEVMDEMLRYIYTGKCQNLNKFAEDLLGAANKYALDRLKTMCMKELYKTLSVENAAKILVLADLHFVEGLKVEVIKFIVAKFTDVSNTKDWKNILSHPQLVGEVFETLASSMRSMGI